MTDTPETDAACHAIYAQGVASIPLVGFMEKLERERDEAREIIAMQKELIARLGFGPRPKRTNA